MMTKEYSPNDARLRTYDAADLATLPQLDRLPAAMRSAMRAVAAVLPFRVNQYVIDQLIDWDRVPDDPIFRLTFPHPDMLGAGDVAAIEAALAADDGAELRRRARRLQEELNPHPAGQVALNVPSVAGRRAAGIQHKYAECVLFFPRQGQTCHTYCSYCFRWPQFVGLESLRFAAHESTSLAEYLRGQPGVTDVLFTGGDPMVMRARVLEAYLEPLLAPGCEHVRTIRMGSKALAYWPHRFVDDRDADDLLRLFERVIAAGKSLAFMAHVSHPRELSTPIVQAAIARIRSTGATIRSQAPLMKHVNDSVGVWVDAWRAQVDLGIVPYYMFVARDTGPRAYFEVPLARAHEIYVGAISQVSGLARTARGPSMSTTNGKVVVDGTVELAGQRALVLRYLQARDPSWVGRPFLAHHCSRASWLSDLRPVLGRDAHLFDPPRLEVPLAG
jgi:L-lysine 2,3-aminomutase